MGHELRSRSNAARSAAFRLRQIDGLVVWPCVSCVVTEACAAAHAAAQAIRSSLFLGSVMGAARSGAPITLPFLEPYAITRSTGVETDVRNSRTPPEKPEHVSRYRGIHHGNTRSAAAKYQQ